MKHITLAVLIALVLFLTSMPSVSASSGCSTSAFDTACKSCSFSDSGQIDANCKDGYQTTGKTCLMAAYPLAAEEYASGDCPEIDACINKFNACVDSKCPGTDKEDCSNYYCMICYNDGDVCLDEAAQKCTQRFYDESPLADVCPCYGILPLTLVSVSLMFAVPVILKRKQ